VLRLNIDGSFTLTGKLTGVSRTDKGTWSIAGETITLSFTHVGTQAEQFTKVARLDNDSLALETRVQNRDIAAIFSKHINPPWFTILRLIIMVCWVGGVVSMYVRYAPKESPKISFQRNPLELAGILIFLFIIGIITTFKPVQVMVIWGVETVDTFYTLQWMGILALIVVAVITWITTEGGIKNVIKAILILGLIALFVWVFFRFGIELPIPTP
jgi:hypothetical protein